MAEAMKEDLSIAENRRDSTVCYPQQETYRKSLLDWRCITTNEKCEVKVRKV
jgi:hypothetical protein